MFMVMTKMMFGIDDAFHCEYSGIEHDTEEAAIEEYNEAKLHEVDNEALIYLYIKED